jgi:hypothetical protein
MATLVMLPSGSVDAEGLMGASLEIRTDLASPARLRRLARRERDPRTTSRMLAIAGALVGLSRAEAARLAEVERQALRNPVTTRKDFVRIPPQYRSRVTVVTVRLAWEEAARIEALIDPLAARVPIPA